MQVPSTQKGSQPRQSTFSRITNTLLRRNRNRQPSVSSALSTQHIANEHTKPKHSVYEDDGDYSTLAKDKKISGEPAVLEALQILGIDSENDDSFSGDIGSSKDQQFIDAFKQKLNGGSGYIRFPISVASECIITKNTNGEVACWIKSSQMGDEADAFLALEGLAGSEPKETPVGSHRYFGE